MHYDMKGESLRPIEIAGDSESDKDLVITTLTESLQIHKEIMERLHSEREAFIDKMERERSEEQEITRKEKEQALQAMEEQLERYERLESAYNLVVSELETKKTEYKKMESRFYDHVRSIRPTDDDLSTIQYEITHLTSQLNNFCMGLKSKMDRSGGTAFVLKRWHHREQDIRQCFLSQDDNDNDDRLDAGVLTLFTEKFVMEILRSELFDQPIHAGVSINDTFKTLSDWIEERNSHWANRLRQQVSALVVRQPGDDEKANMEKALATIVDTILDQLSEMYPRIKDGDNQRKKIDSIVSRAAKLNLAMKGQEIKVFCPNIEEGVARFDETMMKPSSRSDPQGIVMFTISPAFVALDPKDDDHGFVIPGKVFCKSE
ncbi:hypothetical protein LRAMOSA01503 [Lichtheimia ramosa]|uniref:Uncharacterized protein n=1 Tax=Lichtheimia ramosa TaxID=688394 RepID=A0A077WKB8_9FUNG|nr:hypothetical protein LRAMOSA01503 [Lichtheimia ramosa]